MINEGKQGVPDTVKSTLTAIWWLFFSCMLYPGAYLMPLMIDGEMGVVARHMTYGAADISSKIIYGVLLTHAAQKMSEAEGYVYAEDETVGEASIAT